MTSLPLEFVERIKEQAHLGPDALIDALDSTPSVSIRKHPLRPVQEIVGNPIPWCAEGLSLEERPSFILDPAWHAGNYYVQEANSMAISKVLRNWDAPEHPLALDLCAAPGGKSTLAQDWLYPLDGFLVANEPIPKRNSILRENLVRWGYPNVAVTQNEVNDFANAGMSFDLILLDAPCSGEGMFRKDPDARDHWSIEATQNCSLRSKEILEGALKLLRPGGMLVYSTCTFNPGENEELLDSCLSEEFEVLPLSKKEYTAAIPVDIKDGNGLYFLPGRTPGEGLFLCAVKKAGERQEEFAHSPKNRSIQMKAHLPIAKGEELFYWEDHKGLWAIRQDWAHLLDALHAVNTKWKGIHLGQMVRDELKWSDTLAHSLLFDGSPFPMIELEGEQALDYLRGHPLRITGKAKGYYMVKHGPHLLGAAKGAGNRLNNLYPSGWRIKHL